MKIGIIGAGQLGRMLALAGYPLGLRFVFLDQSSDAPGAQVGHIITGAFDAADKLQELASAVDVITFDVENVPVDAVSAIAQQRPFLPPPNALAISQDRLYEKQQFNALRIPTAPFAAVESLAELRSAVSQLGLPGILKTRRLGYDGRGQYHLKRPGDIPAAWEALAGVPLIYEGFVAFSHEVSIIGVRSTRGEIACYPLCANTHERGILHYSVAPHRNTKLQRQAQIYLKRLLHHFDYAGVLTIEFFVKRGELIANEMAPRVHNSGHWTIEGARTSQFENHIRAILGLPLGSTEAIGHSAMVNFIGTVPELTRILKLQGAHFHGYGKQPRPNRKLAHCTINAASPASRDRTLQQLLRLARSN